MMRGSKTHQLKCDGEWFSEIANGWKKFEIRVNDRDFQRDDKLLLERWDSSKGQGQYIMADVVRVYKDVPGVKDGFVVLLLDNIHY